MVNGHKIVFWSKGLLSILCKGLKAINIEITGKIVKMSVWTKNASMKKNILIYINKITKMID